MKKEWSIYLLIFFLVMMPVLQISGHFINLSEFYIYVLFVLNYKKFKPDINAKALNIYLISFLLVSVFTAILAKKILNNHDFFILRNGIQFSFVILIFKNLFEELYNEGAIEKVKSVILRCLVVLSIPALLVLLQRFNVLGFRSLVINLYKPQFFFLGSDVFAEYRYTSVFKDFFTAAIYFTILSSAIYYFTILKTVKSRDKFIGIFLLGLNFSVQFFVARTSLLMIPVGILAMNLLSGELKPLSILKRLIMFILILVPFLFFLGSFILESGIGNTEWIKAAYLVFMTSDEVGGDSSVMLMQSWNESFIDSILNNPMQLFIPHHVYDLTETANPGLYSDGFYPQEVYRYGIYGMFIYFYLILILIKNNFMKNREIVVWTILFLILNYKGGNVMFMPKNIYLYGFLFAASITLTKSLESRSAESVT